MKKEKYRLEEVFKQTGFPEYTYAERDEYDLIFRSSLLSGGALVYLYGDSKSGKTSMWKKYINEGEYIEVKITNKMTVIDFYKELVDQIEPFIKTNFEETEETEASVNLRGEGGLKAVFQASAGTENKDTSLKTSRYERFAFPGLSLTTVSAVASEASKIIILEDFQVASYEFIKEVAHVLKAFADNMIKVIVVGTENKVPDLVKERLDISGRIVTINLSHFKKDELGIIIQKGEEKLNIRFNDEIKEFLIDESFERAYILQGLCRYICIIKGIGQTANQLYEIDDIDDAKRACKLLAGSVKGLYEPTAQNIAQAATKKNKFDTYRWILRVLRKDIIVGNEGVPAMLIATKIKNYVPDFTTASIYPCLNVIPKKQTTEVFRYEDKKLYVNDRLFLFYLKWNDDLWDNLNRDI